MEAIDYRKLSASKLVYLTGCSERTAKRWKAGDTLPPPATLELIDLKLSRRILPPRAQYVGNGVNGTLITSNGERYQWAHLEWYKTVLSCYHAMLGDYRKLAEAVETLEKRAPRSWQYRLDTIKNAVNFHLESANEPKGYDLAPRMLQRKVGC